MVSITAPEGVFFANMEPELISRIYAAMADALDANDDPDVASLIGVTLDVVPAHRFTMGGKPVKGVRIDVGLPAIALGSFRRRRNFIRDATAAVADLASDASVAERTIVRITHLVDGGWGTGGYAVTNESIDDPEPALI